MAAEDSDLLVRSAFTTSCYRNHIHIATWITFDILETLEANTESRKPQGWPRQGLHLIMHRTIRLTGYIGPLTLTLTLVCSSDSPLAISYQTDRYSPLVWSIVKCNWTGASKVAVQCANRQTSGTTLLTNSAPLTELWLPRWQEFVNRRHIYMQQ